MFSEDWWLQLDFHLGIGGNSFSVGMWSILFNQNGLMSKYIIKIKNIEIFP
jgi:hypothetical protein